MSPVILFLLALAAMAILAVARVVRVQLGRTPFPDVRGRFLLVLAFLVGPPILVGAVTPGVGFFFSLLSVPAYLLALLAVATPMAIVGLIAQYVGPGRLRPILMLALVGRQPDPYALPVDPPLSAPLAERLAAVDSANSRFTRGTTFAAEIDRADFRPDWDALDAATRSLEAGIANDRRIGVGVNSRALDTAADARSRLDTLRTMARVHGQAWAADVVRTAARHAVAGPVA